MHCEVTIGYRSNRYDSQNIHIYARVLYRLQGFQGYLLCIVRLRQVTEITDMIHTKMHIYVQFSRLQGLQGYLNSLVTLAT